MWLRLKSLNMSTARKNLVKIKNNDSFFTAQHKNRKVFYFNDWGLYLIFLRSRSLQHERTRKNTTQIRSTSKHNQTQTITQKQPFPFGINKIVCDYRKWCERNELVTVHFIVSQWLTQLFLLIFSTILDMISTTRWDLHPQIFICICGLIKTAVRKQQIRFKVI